MTSCIPGFIHLPSEFSELGHFRSVGHSVKEVMVVHMLCYLQGGVVSQSAIPCPSNLETESHVVSSAFS